MADFILPRSSRPEDYNASRRLAGPVHTERHIRIICVGAGASGLLMAYKLQKHFNNFSLQIYEKNPEVAGTWFENKYPGYVRHLIVYIKNLATVFNNKTPICLQRFTDTNGYFNGSQMRLRCSITQLHLELRAQA